MGKWEVIAEAAGLEQDLGMDCILKARNGEREGGKDQDDPQVILPFPPFLSLSSFFPFLPSFFLFSPPSLLPLLSFFFFFVSRATFLFFCLFNYSGLHVHKESVSLYSQNQFPCFFSEIS